MRPVSFKRRRFPPDVIRHAVWLYPRFTLSIRDVEELLAQRGVEVSREAVRCRVNKFGPLIAANPRAQPEAGPGPCDGPRGSAESRADALFRARVGCHG